MRIILSSGMDASLSAPLRSLKKIGRPRIHIRIASPLFFFATFASFCSNLPDCRNEQKDAKTAKGYAVTGSPNLFGSRALWAPDLHLLRLVASSEQEQCHG